MVMGGMEVVFKLTENLIVQETLDLEKPFPFI
jgi:hypothetical protein